MILMRSMIFFVMAAGLAVMACMCAACVSGPSAQDQAATNKTPVNVGVVTVLETGPHATYSLKDAASAITREYQYQA
ncbi:MAG: hypothetical protein ABFC78_01170, partial [Methanoregula sp.]